MSTADKKMAWIGNMLAAGRTVYVSTMTRVTKITPATARKWEANGHTLFKVSGNSLYMARGSKFDCIDYCELRAN